ncbi:MAG: hydrogenase formation protein HypD [Kiritimatiellaeota bacterium]|nr:hydrogenase formation protein HypD [Kiritimatiellota bacterium]
MATKLQEIHELAARLKRPVQLMEVCGTHTMAIFRTGLRNLLPASLRLLSGPGCPVCVTPDRYLDQALILANTPGTVVATFGDMLRVPGRGGSLEAARARGAQVQVVYSPLDALQFAAAHPDRRVVFLGIGFETTAPTTAWALKEATDSVPNFFVLCGHKTMPAALAALLKSGEVRLDGLICPGHVSVIAGARIFDFIPREFGLPCVVTGFEPADLLDGLVRLLRQIAGQRATVEIQYRRCVTAAGNAKAQALLAEVFEPCAADWRGLGPIPGSGLRIRAAYAGRDAEGFCPAPPDAAPDDVRGCRCGEVLRGVLTPPQCPLFRQACTPDSPRGACMVSSEGTCAAYYRYT